MIITVVSLYEVVFTLTLWSWQNNSFFGTYWNFGFSCKDSGVMRGSKSWGCSINTFVFDSMFIQPSFCSEFSRHCLSQTVRAGELKFQGNVCPPSCVVTCDVSHFRCHVPFFCSFFFRKSWSWLIIFYLILVNFWFFTLLMIIRPPLSKGDLWVSALQWKAVNYTRGNTAYVMWQHLWRTSKVYQSFSHKHC